MLPNHPSFVRPARERLGVIALSTSASWIALLVFLGTAKGEPVDARKVYVIDGETFALDGERIRLLAIDAPEARYEAERVFGAPIAFILHNPSTDRHEVDDPTRAAASPSRMRSAVPP
jgi:hypothetical protein